MNTSILQYKVFCKITLTNKQKFISFSQNQCWNQFEHWLCLKGLIGNLGKLHHVNACALIEQFHQLGCDCCPFIYLLSLQLPFCKGIAFVRLKRGTLSSFCALLCISDFMKWVYHDEGQNKPGTTISFNIKTEHHSNYHQTFHHLETVRFKPRNKKEFEWPPCTGHCASSLFWGAMLWTTQAKCLDSKLNSTMLLFFFFLFVFVFLRYL